MSYRSVISEAIELSGLTVREISKKCEEKGVSVTHSYISQLKNGRVNPPSDEISKVIAEVCGIEPRLLILEAYLDKAPREIIEFINNNRNSTIENMLTDITPNVLEKELIDLKNSLYSEPLSQFILEFNKSINEKLDVNDVLESENMPVEDNSMAPFILKGSIVYYEKVLEYKNEDIVVIIYNNDVLIRKYYEKDNLLLFYPYNLQFEPIITNNENVKLLGKVNKIITYK